MICIFLLTFITISEATPLGFNDHDLQPCKEFSNLASIFEINNQSFSDDFFLPKEAFKLYNTTQCLRLNGLHIANISVGAFDHLKSLQKLELDHNDIVELRVGVFANLSALRHLSLVSNQISVISDGVFGELTSLQSLHLFNNKISEISEGTFSGLRSLQVLELSKNRITSVELDYVVVDDKFSIVFFQLNPLTDISIRKKLHLSSLQLTQTSLRRLQHNLSMLNSKHFYLSKGILEEMDCALLPSVHELLDLSENKVSSIVNSQHPLFSREIHLRSNNLSTLHEMFLRSEVTEMLDLGSNHISTVYGGAFRGLTSLQKLVLDNNKISELRKDIFDGLIKLTYLNISGNKLKSLYEHSIHPLANLKILVIERNEISQLDATDLLSHLNKLEKISLAGNLFSCQSLAKIERILSEKKVNMYHRSTFHLRNFHGIACNDAVDYEVGIPVQILQKVVNESIENSKLEMFFRNFNETDFLDYIDAGENSNTDINSIIQISIFSFVFAVICLFFIFLRKMEVKTL